MTSLWVIPSIWQPNTDDCVRSMHPAINGLEVDNTTRNRGVAASWNIGAECVLAEDAADWLVLCSAAMRFGEPMGMDFEAALAQHDPTTTWAVEGGWGLGWHLIAFSRMTLERVGLFDANLFPGYWEDVDYGWRIRLAADAAGVERPLWPKVDVDAWVRSFAHATRFRGITADTKTAEGYMASKWGPKWRGVSAWRQPFNDARLPVSFWPEPPDPRAVPHEGWDA